MTSCHAPGPEGLPSARDIDGGGAWHYRCSPAPVAAVRTGAVVLRPASRAAATITMPSITHASRWAPAAFALCGALAWPAVARADFEITYLFTDDEGNALINDRLTPQEMQRFVNQATCQCGLELAARVYLNRTSGTNTYSGNTQIRTYVGAQCDQGQDNLGQQRPCVKVHQGLANDYDDGGIFITFDSVWLSSRTPMIETSPDDGEPIMPCAPSQQGGGGIWICVESNGQPDCQRDEFVVMGNSSTNGGAGTTPTDPMGGMAPANNVTFDYIPPQDTFSGFHAEPGDGHVVVTWDRGEVADTSGFRVLCADMDGNPIKDGITSVPTGQERVTGKYYYTASSLCPDGGVHAPDPSDPGTDPFGDTGEMTTTGDATTGDATTGDATTGDATTGDGRATDAGSTTAGDPGGGGSTSCDDPSSSALCSLDWRYVCSDHVSNTGSKADVLGLRNGTPYQFLVVAYDAAGNAKPVSDVFVESPEETSDFWEQCEQQGDLCGDGGFCACRSSSAASRGAAWLGTGLLLLLGIAARRRRIGA